MVQQVVVCTLKSAEPWMEHIGPGTTRVGTDRTLTPMQQADANIGLEANRGCKDTENNTRHAINENLILMVTDTYKSNVMVAVAQESNYPQNADPRAIINVLRIRYNKPTPNEEISNKAAFSAPWNTALPMEYCFFCLEECYVTTLVALLAYTMEKMVDKVLTVIQYTGLFYHAVFEWNELLLDNNTWSELKAHLCEAYKD